MVATISQGGVTVEVDVRITTSEAEDFGRFEIRDAEGIDGIQGNLGVVDQHPLQPGNADLSVGATTVPITIDTHVDRPLGGCFVAEAGSVSGLL